MLTIGWGQKEEEEEKHEEVFGDSKSVILEKLRTQSY